MPKITFLQDQITIEVPQGTPIVLAAAKAGSSHPFGCKRGACRTCLAYVVEGEKNITSRSGPIEGPIRLACQSRIEGDLTIRPVTDEERQIVCDGEGEKFNRDEKRFRREGPPK